MSELFVFLITLIMDKALYKDKNEFYILLTILNSD